MTNNEFKAWFEGFSEGVHGAPSQYQWGKIVEKVAKIDGTPWLPQVVYRDRYPVWPYGQHFYSASGAGMRNGETFTTNTTNMASTEGMSQLRDMGRVDSEDRN